MGVAGVLLSESVLAAAVADVSDGVAAMAVPDVPTRATAARAVAVRRRAAVRLMVKLMIPSVDVGRAVAPPAE
jgi:hypothetical protein